MVNLLDHIKVGGITAANRVWMAPLTRCRANRSHVPTDIMAEYYAQRAGAGLIIGEATGISRQGLGVPFAPGLWSPEQVEAWTKITDAVHSRGGKILAQLWHQGRAVHSSVTGQPPVSSSATYHNERPYTYKGRQDPEPAHPLSVAEIKEVVEDYKHAAENALRANFDGVQITAGNGFLIEQFMKDSDNFREDEYGGSVENRLRFLHDVLEGVLSTVGSDRTALRLTPTGNIHGISESQPQELASELALSLNDFNLMFLELKEDPREEKVHSVYNEVYRGPLILNEEYKRVDAEKVVGSGEASAVTFGRPFISNPDLVEKIRHKDDNWTKDVVSRWYLPGPKGYTDYPIKYK